jgi:CDP-glycerol glycerophosphotransferase (TagB/SpsB family)
MPSVSVVIPVFDEASALIGALNSVIAQTCQDFEIIVADDGSARQSRATEVLLEAGGAVERICHPKPGSSSARNAAIARARGNLIAFLDADSEWMPEKLLAQVDYFARYASTGLLCTGVVGGSFRRGGKAGPPRAVFGDVFHARFTVNTSTVMVRRQVFEQAGGFREYGDMEAEDWDLWLRIAAHHPIGYLPEPLTFQRFQRPTNLEGRYGALQDVIDNNRSLCERACLIHRSSPRGRCVSSRRYVLHRQWASVHLQAGNRGGAREQLWRALACSPWHPDAALVYVSTFLNGRSATSLRQSSRVESSHPQADSNAARQAPGMLSGWTIPSLIHDTLYRRSRRRLISRLHDFDDILSKTGRARKRILFDAVSPMSFAVFRPLYERLRLDNRLELWFTAHGAIWTPEEIFGTHGISEHIVSASAAARMKADAYVNTDFWDMTWLHRRTRRVHLFHGVAGKYGLDAPIDLAPTIGAFDCLMFANADRRTRYIEAGLVPDDDVKAALVGYPKMDQLVDGSLDRREIARGLALDPAVPAVIYAPTWSPYSSLNAMGEETVERLTAEGLQVIVKLHDRSYDRRERGSGGIDWAARLAKYSTHPLVRVVRDADGSPFMTVADVMVSDHSSIAFEYMLLDRPIVVIDRPDLIAKAGISADKVNRLREASDVADDAVAMTRAVVAALQRPERLSAQRRRTAGELFYRPGSATDRAVQLIYRLIGLPALVDAPSAFGSNHPLTAAG